eukprot:gene11014-23010_t
MLLRTRLALSQAPMQRCLFGGIRAGVGKSFTTINRNALIKMAIPSRTVYTIPTAAEKVPTGESRQYAVDENVGGDHTGRQQNHIWSREEIEERFNNLYRYEPQNLTDHTMKRLMYTLYHTFNFITGYKHSNPSIKSIEWRLIALEYVAGVHGFLAAGFPHFRSLRSLQSDTGWI